MTEEDKHWLAGVFDSRGSISMSKSGNVTGVITFNFSSSLMCLTAMTMISSEDIWCNPAILVGKTFKLNFTSSRGSQVLSLLLPYIRNVDHLRRAGVFMEVFSMSRKGKHMKVDRLEGYNKWLKMLRDEENDSSREDVLDKIYGRPHGRA